MCVNLYRLSHKLYDENSSITYCQELEFLAKQMRCPSCKTILSKVYKVKRAGRLHSESRFQCNKKRCKKSAKNQIPLRKGTWFGHSNLSLQNSMILVYCFIHKLPFKEKVHETSISSAESDSDKENVLVTSTETVADYLSYCREIRQWSVETKQHADQPTGGPGLTVAIDESKFGKTKYRRGRFVEGQCVWRQMLTTIISDCWKTYNSFEAFGFQHHTVNHKYNSVDPLTGARTNAIESLWWQIKRQMRRTRNMQTSPTICVNMCGGMLTRERICSKHSYRMLKDD
uniref:ISXO2-like transposase domain-containing protein n=1 Tax=Octopus bimaculoides TaxID=37653 RepID=A0A0L8GM65_OCTBM